jgi:hypothetical protein
MVVGVTIGVAVGAAPQADMAITAARPIMARRTLNKTILPSQ